MNEDVLIDTFASWYSGAYDEMAEEAREFLRELKAQAWDEGREAVYDFQHRMIRDPGLKPPPNPYRGGQ